jgi:hypothetical protein
LSVIGNSIFEEGTKTEWFFEESRVSVRQQWAADRKAARPQVRDHGYSGMSPAFCFFAPWVAFFEKEQSL